MADSALAEPFKFEIDRIVLGTNKGNIASKTTTVSVGEHVVLKAVGILPGQQNALFSTVQWAIPGREHGNADDWAINNYVQSQQSGVVTPISDPDLQSEQIGYYWIDGGTGLVVTVDATLFGIPFHRTATFDVLRPEASFGVVKPLGSVQDDLGSLSFGTDAAPGISFRAAVTPQVGGDICVTQPIRPGRRWLSRSDGTVVRDFVLTAPGYTAGDSVLDDPTPYPKSEVPILAGHTGTFWDPNQPGKSLVNDSPYEPLPAPSQGRTVKVTAFETFGDYLMYRPGAPTQRRRTTFGCRSVTFPGGGVATQRSILVRDGRPAATADPCAWQHHAPPTMGGLFSRFRLETIIGAAMTPTFRQTRTARLGQVLPTQPAATVHSPAKSKTRTNGRRIVRAAWAFAAVAASAIPARGSGAVPDKTAQPPENRWSRKSQEAGIPAAAQQAYRRLSRVSEVKLSELDLRTLFMHLPNANPLRNSRRWGSVPCPSSPRRLTTPRRRVRSRGPGATRLESRPSAAKPACGGSTNWLPASSFRSVAATSQSAAAGTRRPSGKPASHTRNEFPEFRKPVTAWYAENKGRSLEERMIADLWDPYPGNRGTAGGWLARHKSAAAVPSLLKRLEAVIAGEGDTGEVADLCLVLADIAGEQAFPAVKKGFSYVIRHDSDPNAYGARGAIEAMSRLGHKAEAEAECKRAHEAHQKAMRQWKRGPDGSGFDIPGE